MREHVPMASGGGDGGPVPPATPTDVPFDDRVLDTPNCPRCLTRMEAVESPGGEPYWSCTACGQTALA